MRLVFLVAVGLLAWIGLPDSWLSLPAVKELTAGSLILVASLTGLWSSFRSGVLSWFSGWWAISYFVLAVVGLVAWSLSAGTIVSIAPSLVLGLAFILTAFSGGDEVFRQRLFLVGIATGFIAILIQLFYFPDAIAGSWFDLGWLAVLALVFGSVVLDGGGLVRAKKIVVWFLTVAGLVGMIFTNQWFLWLIAVLGLGLIIVSGWRFARWWPHSTAAFVLTVFGAFSLSSVTPLGHFWQEQLRTWGVGRETSVMTWSAAFELAARATPTQKIFGYGWGRLADAWREHRPVPTPISPDGFFTDVDRGPGWLATWTLETGALGLGAWLFFSVCGFIVYGRIFYDWWRRQSPTGEPPDFFPVVSVAGASMSLLIFWFWPLGFVGAFYAVIILSLPVAGIGANRMFLRRSIVLRELNPGFRIWFYVLGIAAALLLAIVLFYLVIGSVARAYAERAERFLVLNPDSILSLDLANTAVYWRAHDDDYWRVVTAARLQQFNTALRSKLTTTDDKLASLTKDLLAVAAKAVELNPADARNWFSQGYVFEFLAMAGLPGAWPQAAEAYRKAAGLDPYQPLRNLAAARALVEAGDKTDGPDFYLGRFLSASAEEPSAWFQAGYIFYNVENWERAAALFEQALVLDQNYADARYLLALSEERLGLTERALANLRLVAAANPEHPAVAEALSRLTVDPL